MGGVIGRVSHLHLSTGHSFSKKDVEEVILIAGVGVDGDCHSGPQVQHRSRVHVDPTQPNLRQIHLIEGELLDELALKGFRVGPGDLGENVTTRGVDLMALPAGSVLRIGERALVGLTGLRNPCRQLDLFQDGLRGAVVARSPIDGTLNPRAGVMGVVLLGGAVRQGDQIAVRLPPGEPVPLRRV